MSCFFFKIGDLRLNNYRMICGGFCGYKDASLSSISNNVIGEECYQVKMVYVRLFTSGSLENIFHDLSNTKCS